MLCKPVSSIPTCSLFLCFVYQWAPSLHAACFCALFASEQHPYITFFLLKFLSLYNIWLCRGKHALFTHTNIVKTRCTGKLLQGEMCQSSIDKTTRTQLIMKNVPWLSNIPVSCIYNSFYFHSRISIVIKLDQMT